MGRFGLAAVRGDAAELVAVGQVLAHGAQLVRGGVGVEAGLQLQRVVHLGKAEVERHRQGDDGRRLEAEVGLEVLGDLADEALEGELADEQLGGLLVLADLAQRDGARAVAVGLLDAAGGGGGLARRLGGELLAGGLASGGLASGLLGTGHGF